MIEMNQEDENVLARAVSSIAELVGHAVATLEDLHSNRASLSDQYAIATLAKRHVGVLIKHQRIEAANEAAKRYFDEIGRIGTAVRDDVLETTRTELLHFLTHGTIPQRQDVQAGRRQPKRDGKRHRRNRR